MDIPHQELEPSTLKNIITEFVTRDGTDYGHVELSMESKIKRVKKMLDEGVIKLIYDEENECVNVVEVS